MKNLFITAFLMRAARIEQAFHKEKLLLHTILVYLLVCFYTHDKSTRMAAILHDVGKEVDPSLTQGESGAEILHRYMREGSKYFTEVQTLVKYHMLHSIVSEAWATPEQKAEAQKILSGLPLDIQKKLQIIAKADAKATL